MNNKHVVLVDLSALFHPAWRATPATDPISNAYDGTIGGVHRIADKYPDSLIAICCDGRGSWRKEKNPEYKANRDKLPDVFYKEFARVKERLTGDGFLLWEFDTFEGDDVIATATAHALKVGHAVTVATHDKDLFQLVNDSLSVDVLSLTSWEIRRAADVEKKFGVPPEKIGDFLALTGDSSDNIDGCPGCGPVTAAKFLTRFKDLDDIAANKDKLHEVGGTVLAEKMRKSWDSIVAGRKLIELSREVPLKWEEIYEKREPKPLPGGASTALALVNSTDTTDGDGSLIPAESVAGQEKVYVGSQKNVDENQYFGFVGAGAEPFPQKALDVLAEPVDRALVDIREDGKAYLPGVHFRRILNRAFGPGGWALLPRRPPAADRGLVVWHGVLVCLGRFVSEAVGEAMYRPNNPNDSYPTSVEKAKTDCLTRCCKDLGIAWELWDKKWTAEWMRSNCESFEKDGKTRWRMKK